MGLPAVVFWSASATASDLQSLLADASSETETEPPMAGSRRRRRRRARPPQAEPSPPPASAALDHREIDAAERPSKKSHYDLGSASSPLLLVPTTVSSRELVVAEKPSEKTCHDSGSTSSSLSEPYVWSYVLDSLLHQIISLFSSFHDFLAFTSTCRSWRAAISSFPPVYPLNFPPLHLKPDGDYKYILLSNCKWKLSDPSKKNISLCCSAPQNTQNRMCYLGCSYGYLILSYKEDCLLLDVYSGMKVKPPRLQSNSCFQIYYGILTSPLRSPNSHLLLCSRNSMFLWQVGTNSWSEQPFGGERILRIVSFKGEMFAMDILQRLHTIRLAPQLSMQEVATVWGDDMIAGLHYPPWLVVCGDTLLMVEVLLSIDPLSGFSGTFQVFRLDFSVVPATWVKMEKLENQALFVSLDRKNPTFSCMSPERWGGKSNCIYVARQLEDSYDPWTAVELGQPVPSAADCVSYSLADPPGRNTHCSQLENLWVLPSLVYGTDQ